MIKLFTRTKRRDPELPAGFWTWKEYALERACLAEHWRVTAEAATEQRIQADQRAAASCRVVCFWCDGTGKVPESAPEFTGWRYCSCVAGRAAAMR